MEYAIVFLPLIGAIVSGFFGKITGDRFSEIFTSFLVSISAILSFVVFYFVVVQGYANNITIFSWITSGDLKVIGQLKSMLYHPLC
jgi:NADH-quinone oxidoreductase subunit L